MALESVTATQRAGPAFPVAGSFQVRSIQVLLWQPVAQWGVSDARLPNARQSVQSLSCHELRTDDKASPYFLDPTRLFMLGILWTLGPPISLDHSSVPRPEQPQNVLTGIPLSQTDANNLKVRQTR
ncbi:hypothetical protein GX50_03582 [[Emmonsia] crescens]|uniref:Uncharacterized protein n=1 Tax=[Emmonsia] crescens TaxID=73230 RepID=A0A2B7ZAW8_9EURO|nr:hypothetical protein GX50_03582 [Emmonsia crescens]